MRSILITVMMLIVVAVMFSGVINSAIKPSIESQGEAANLSISGLEVD